MKGLKPRETLKMEALVGEWVVECEACGSKYQNHVGSTPCCGALARIVERMVDPEEQKRANAELLRKLKGEQDS